MASPSSPLKIRPDEEPDGAPLTSWYTQGVTDGFGDRLLMFDNAATGPVELLRIRHEFTLIPGFESALRQRFSTLSSFVHPGFAQARVVNHLENGGGLTVASSHVTGTRLSALFEASRPLPGMHPGAVREVFGDLVASIGDLHRCGPAVAHGALSADRIILTFDRRLVVTDYIFGSALERLNLPAARLWSEFGLVNDSGTSLVRLDQRGDLTQLGLLMLCLVLGRRVTPEEYPRSISGLLDDFAAAADRRAPDLTAPMSAWLEQSLDPSGFESVAEASQALASFPPRPHYLDLHAPETKALATPVPHNALAAPAAAAAAPPAPDTVSHEAAVAPPVALVEPVPEPLAVLPVAPPVTIDVPELTPAEPVVAIEPLVDGEGGVAAEPGVVEEHIVPDQFVAISALTVVDAPERVEDTVAPPPSVIELDSDVATDSHIDLSTDRPVEVETTPAPAFIDEPTTPTIDTAPPVDAPDVVSHEASADVTIIDHVFEAEPPVTLTEPPVAASMAPADAPVDSLADEPDYDAELASLIDALHEVHTSHPALELERLDMQAAGAAPPGDTPGPDFDDIDARYNAPLRRPDAPSTTVTARLDSRESILADPPLPSSSLFLRPDPQTSNPSSGSLGSLLRVPPSDPPPTFIVPESGRDEAAPEDSFQFIKLTSRLRSAPEPPPPLTTLQRPALSDTRREPFAWAGAAQETVEADEEPVSTASATSPLVWWVIAALVILVIGQGALLVRLSSRPVSTRVHIESGAQGDAVVVDGKTVGVTPLDLPLDSASAVVQIVPRARSASAQTPGNAPPLDTAATAKAAFEALQQPDLASGRVAGIRLVSAIALEVMDGKEYLGSSARGPIYTTPGTHDLALVNNTVGFRTTQRVTAVAGSVSPVQVTLPSGIVSVTTQPPAQVWIDGRFAGNSPLASLSLPIGEHELVFRHPTLGERRQKTVVQNHQTTRVSVSFNP